MKNAPKTNVVGALDDAGDAEAAVKELYAVGFSAAKIGVTPQSEGAVVSVQADGRHAEAAAEMEGSGAITVQNVAR